MPRPATDPRVQIGSARVGPRVAVIHDWLVTYAGSERVLEQILALYPGAEVFTIVDFLPDEERGFVCNRPVHTSFIQKLPLARTRFRSYLPLMPLAIEQLDVSGFDLVISSSHAVAKGVLTGPTQPHLCYCHSPIRYAWDLQHQYLRESGMERGMGSWLARWILHRLRMWDVRTANGVDAFAANSEFIAARIRKAYRREAEVVYPPVDVGRFTPRFEKDAFYLAASRMVPYKKMPLIAEAFSRMPERRLVMIGTGPELERVRAAAGPNVQVLGHQPFEVLKDHMQRARAFVFAAEEDFGITPVEAQACGTPVIAYGAGGATETVVDEVTGLFFEEQSPDAIVEAIERFEAVSGELSAVDARRNAERFGEDVFRDRFKAFVASATAPGGVEATPELDRPAEAPRPLSTVAG